MANNHSEIEKRLWASADELRANSKLKSSEYSVPDMRSIFLRYADHRFTQAEMELAGKGTGRRGIDSHFLEPACGSCDTLRSMPTNASSRSTSTPRRRHLQDYPKGLLTPCPALRLQRTAHFEDNVTCV